MQQYLYESEIFDSKTKAVENFILNSLEAIEEEKTKSIIAFHERERSIKEELKQLEKLWDIALKESKSAYGATGAAIGLQHQTYANDLYKQACLDKFNKDIRRSYFLIKKNQELLSEIINKYEPILVDTESTNPDFQSCVKKMHDVVANRITALSLKIEEMNAHKRDIKAMIDNGESNIDVLVLITAKTNELKFHREDITRLTKEKMLIKDAEAYIRKHMAAAAEEDDDDLLLDEDILELVDEDDLKELGGEGGE